MFEQFRACRNYLQRSGKQSPGMLAWKETSTNWMGVVSLLFFSCRQWNPLCSHYRCYPRWKVWIPNWLLSPSLWSSCWSTTRLNYKCSLHRCMPKVNLRLDIQGYLTIKQSPVPCHVPILEVTCCLMQNVLCSMMLNKSRCKYQRTKAENQLSSHIHVWSHAQMSSVGKNSEVWV